MYSKARIIAKLRKFKPARLAAVVEQAGCNAAGYDYNSREGRQRAINQVIHRYEAMYGDGLDTLAISIDLSTDEDHRHRQTLIWTGAVVGTLVPVAIAFFSWFVVGK